jgi:transcriptional regulator with XRE-family HTH domain
MPNIQRTELSSFLRARRAAVSALAAGLRETGRRRTPGLRREEVAALAGVSITWYTWLEQGRDIKCSPDVLMKLSKALKLSETDTAYLFRLSGYPAPMQRLKTHGLDPGIQLVFDGFTGPAFAMNPRLDVVAFNALADAVFDFDGYPGPFGRNHIWRGFMDSDRRKMYVDWSDVMSKGVGGLRAHYATRTGDEDFELLIASLLGGSEDFKRMWGEQHTHPLESLQVGLVHPRMGSLTFLSFRLLLPTVPDHIALFLPPADAQTANAISRFARG